MTDTTKIQPSIATDGGHWYTREGKPAYEIEGKNGKVRRTTLADARRHALLAGVTSITGEANKPALNTWKEDGLLDIAAQFPLVGDLDDWKTAVRIKASEYAANARDVGSSIHTAVENALHGRDMHPLIVPLVNWLQDTYPRDSWDYMVERSFAENTHGYGGRIDLGLVNKVRPNHRVLIDFKSTDKPIETAKGWDDQLMQLAAGAVGLGWAIGTDSTELMNIYIHRETGEFRVWLWDTKDHRKGWEMFHGLLSYWKAKRGYYPEVQS